MREGGLGDDGLLVIAADNLFEFSLADYIAFWRAKGGSAIAVHKLADPSLASLYGVVELDSDDRIAGMEEKPDHPRSDLVSTATYLFSEEHLGLFDRYFDEGNPPDPPGRFVTWLAERNPVFGIASARPGSTSATRPSCSRRTTSTAQQPGCLPARSTRPTDSVAPVEEPAQSRHRHVTFSGLP